MNRRIVILAGALVAARLTAQPAVEPGAVTVLDLETALRMAAATNLTLRGGALASAEVAQRVREEGGRFDPVLELSYNRTQDTNGNPSDPGTSRPTFADARENRYQVGLGGYLPSGGSVQVGGTFAHPRAVYDSTTRNYDYYYSFLGVSVTQPLLRNFGPRAALAPLRLARAQGEAALWQYRQSVDDTLTATAIAFYELAYAHGVLRITERSVAAVDQLVSDNEKRESRGAMSTQDVVEARTRAARRRETLIAARLGVTEAENRLKRFIYADFAAATDRRLEPRMAPAGAPLPEELRGLAVDAVGQRPDFRQAQLGVEQRKIELGLQRNAVLPAVDLVGRYGYNGTGGSYRDSYDDARSRENDSFSIGAVVSVPLPNRTALARRRAAVLALRRAEVGLLDLEQEIRRQLADGMAAIESARERVVTTRQARSLAEQNLEAEEKRLRAGTSSTFLVLEQQEILADTQMRELRAAADLADTVADFQRLCGRTVAAFGLDASVLTPAAEG